MEARSRDTGGIRPPNAMLLEPISSPEGGRKEKGEKIPALDLKQETCPKLISIGKPNSFVHTQNEQRQLQNNGRLW